MKTKRSPSGCRLRGAAGEVSARRAPQERAKKRTKEGRLDMAIGKMSRRQFLGTAAVVAGAAALPSLLDVTPAVANPSLTLPASIGPIPDASWTQLDATGLARQAYEIYKGVRAPHSACCEASYWPIVAELGNRFPTTWGTIPTGLFNYGGGGVNAWGCICGIPNGGSALLSQIGATTAMKDTFMTWYETTALPTNAAYLDYTSGTWTPGGTATAGWGPFVSPPANTLVVPFNNIPKSVAKALLCHTSLTRWRAAADAYMTSLGYDIQRDRCAKLCYDCVYYLATMINAWKASGNGAFTDQVTADASTAGCRNPSCHGGPVVSPTCPTTAQGLMECTSCHSLNNQLP